MLLRGDCRFAAIEHCRHGIYQISRAKERAESNKKIKLDDDDDDKFVVCALLFEIIFSCSHARRVDRIQSERGVGFCVSFCDE